jgi:hypothetical protein
MATTTDLTTEEQYRLVHQGIAAVAAHCDGALTNDKVGFNGQDTKFGKRIGSVDFSAWTDDIKVEAARIANTYRKQIAAYLDFDITTLPVVTEALDAATNYSARQQARSFGKPAPVRKVDFDPTTSRFSFEWAKGDPDFSALLEAVKALPGRRFDWGTKQNLAPHTSELEAFIQTWDFPLSDAAARRLKAGVPVSYHINVFNDTQVVIDAPYSSQLVALVKTLPGRRWVADRKVNLADISPDVVDLAEGYGLTISPAARVACEAVRNASGAQAPITDRKALMAYVSRLSDNNNLPEAFVELFHQVVPQV